MANCISNLGVVHTEIDFNNHNEVVKFCNDILSVDNDLTENETEFQEDTLELGYENEAERIIHEVIEAGHTGKELITQVSDAISNQEFFGGCELSFEDNSVVFVYGGNVD